MVNRGYSSTTAMHDASLRFKRATGKRHMLYLGDHDPSGLDMIRDIRSRFTTFGVGVNIHPIALTMKQIEEHGPPPNPARVKDPRAGRYVYLHGHESWELDALTPGVLNDLLDTELRKLIDMDAYNEIVAEEEEEKERLRRLAEDI